LTGSSQHGTNARADLMSFMIVRGLGVRNAGGANRNESEEVEVRKKNPVWLHSRRTEMFFNGKQKRSAQAWAPTRCLCVHAGRSGG